ncbi:conserved hypothetical protein [Dickeya parazeae Ech586]|uniref:Uncharacterized protein n=1 Tax=Dickeya zeae (strain Ech586) TaxID=590409 RepID=D2BWV9_DICZ5|nr:hypothetical protein [Dickeya parazeae]ACZ76343.1 conserved hypothetical protein [Dickeya parazeae Ech586]
MINSNLIDMENVLSSPSFFDFLKNLDVDNALDSRDSKTFDSEWMNNFNRLEKEVFSKDDLDFIDILREKSFKLSFKIIKESEIASRISDDIEIIAKDILKGNTNGWPINYLWQSYKNGKFPA